MGTDDTDATARAWLRAWGEDVANADIAAGRRRFREDLVAFGTHADVVRGRDEVEAEQWAKVWPAIEDFRFLVDDADVIVSADELTVVLVTGWTSTGFTESGERFSRPGRATIVLRRDALDGEWMGIHTHFSLGRGVPASTYGRRTAIR